jgi:hypothetical protein
MKAAGGTSAANAISPPTIPTEPYIPQPYIPPDQPAIVEAATELKPVEATLPAPAGKVSGQGTRPMRPRGRGRPVILIGMGTLVLVAVVVGGFVLGGSLNGGSVTSTPEASLDSAASGLGETITAQAQLLTAPSQTPLQTLTQPPTDAPTTTDTIRPTLADQGDTPVSTTAALPTASAQPTSISSDCPYTCPAGMTPGGCTRDKRLECDVYLGRCASKAECQAECGAAGFPPSTEVQAVCIGQPDVDGKYQCVCYGLVP